VPRPDRKFRVFLGGTSDRTYELAAERGWAVVVPPLLPYAALAEQLDLYRAKCAEHGNEPDIVWIHACYIDEDREVAKREAEQWLVRFLAGNASPLTDYEPPPADELNAAGYGFYTAGILEKLARTPYEEMIAGDIVWVGTPADVIERIEAVRELCAGLTEISITVNAGGADHWQAIKAQELFAHTVMPHFKAGAREVVGKAT
jgi:alkanesulfonate monooxygenase SsuD/methylene tetrahydromethanopterin reductase-like flavin-dependent oxidoreductase (luciferase family)